MNAKKAFILGLKTNKSWRRFKGDDEAAWRTFVQRVSDRSIEVDDPIGFAYIAGYNYAGTFQRNFESKARKALQAQKSKVAYQTVTIAQELLRNEVLRAAKKALAEPSRLWAKRISVFADWIKNHRPHDCAKRDARYQSISRAKRDLLDRLSPAAVEWLETLAHAIR